MEALVCLTVSTMFSANAVHQRSAPREKTPLGDLGKLPLELRNIVYHFCLGHGYLEACFRVATDDLGYAKRYDTNILSLSKIMRSEAQLVEDMMTYTILIETDDLPPERIRKNTTRIVMDSTHSLMQDDGFVPIQQYPQLKEIYYPRLANLSEQIIFRRPKRIQKAM
jgi:hypothetical protein